tara:strand:- start:151 stop:276 length:126 start_codon:yes stop_codon:yes gene_type:complete
MLFQNYQKAINSRRIILKMLIAFQTNATQNLLSFEVSEGLD